MSRCLKGLDTIIGQGGPLVYNTPAGGAHGHGLPFGWGGMNPAWWAYYYGSGPEIEMDEVTEAIRHADSRDLQIRGESPCLQGLDVCIGSDLVGAFNIASWQQKMNKFKEVPVGIAQILLLSGQNAINWGIKTAKTAGLSPRTVNRDNVFWKLKWHEDTIKELSPAAVSTYTSFSTDKDAYKKAGEQLAKIYPHGNDLKKWVMEAFIEANSVEEGAVALAEYWNRMWTEIGQAYAALPAIIAKKVGDVVETTAWYLKWTYWVAIAAAAVAIGFIAWGIGSGVKKRIESS